MSVGEIKKVRDITIFKDLSEDEASFLGEFLESQTVNPKETILRENQITRSLFLIAKGKVEILINVPGREPKHIVDLDKGNFFGEMSFLDGRLHSASVISMDHCEILILRKKDFDHISQERPFLANKILSSMLKAVLIRLRDTNKKLKEILTGDTPKES
ncbi:MAG: cyclic nucleotide-binding domain-containing protein [bacterium]|nr:cyclic nucleotide-binding domain-containing protein [bacterium]